MSEVLPVFPRGAAAGADAVALRRLAHYVVSHDVGLRRLAELMGLGTAAPADLPAGACAFVDAFARLFSEMPAGTVAEILRDEATWLDQSPPPGAGAGTYRTATPDGPPPRGA